MTAQADRSISCASAGETEEEGYEDEYTLEDLDVTPGDYISAAPVPNFRAAWEALGEEAELGDDYGLGERENLQARPLTEYATTAINAPNCQCA